VSKYNPEVKINLIDSVFYGAAILIITFLAGGLWWGIKLDKGYAIQQEAQRNKDIFEMVGIRCYKDTPSCWVCVGDTFKLRYPDTPREIKDYTIKITELENERFGYINQTTGKASEVDFAVFDGFCRVFVKTGSNTELLNKWLE